MRDIIDAVIILEKSAWSDVEEHLNYEDLDWIVNLAACVHEQRVDQSTKRYRSLIYMMPFKFCRSMIPTKIMRTISESILQSQS